MLPKIVTKIVLMLVNSSIVGSVVSSSMPVETPLPPVPVGRRDHFISNYPI